MTFPAWNNYRDCVVQLSIRDRALYNSGIGKTIVSEYMMKSFYNLILSGKERVVLIHLLIWLSILLLPYYISADFATRTGILFQITLTLFNAAVFYVNYFLLIPSLLFKKKISLYMVCSLMLFAGIFLLQSMIFANNPPPSNIDSPALHSVNIGTLPTRSSFPGNMRIFFSINSFLVFYLAAFVPKFMNRWSADETCRLQLEKDKLSTELSLLKQQINPHFLLNTLNNIYSLSIVNSPNASELILKLASILQYTLYQSEKNMLSTEDELKIIDDYIELQKLRLMDNVTVNYKLVKDAGEYKIEPLIIITLLENAFKFGTDSGSDSFIDIVLVIVENKLVLRIKNKIVKQFAENPRMSGVGLSNVKRRLDLVYRDRYEYRTDIQNKVYSVLLRIDLNDELYCN